MSAPNPYQAPQTDDLAPSSGLVPLFQSQAGRAKLLVGLLVASAVLQVVAAYSTHLEIDLLGRVQIDSVTEAEIDSNDLRQGLLAIVMVALYVVTIVVFARFLHRAAKNARALSGPGETFSFTPGWTVGWFFVPIANIWKPYFAVKELWSKSRPSIPRTLSLWWFAWLIDSFMSRAAFRRSEEAETLAEILDADRLAMISELIAVVSAVLALLVVRAIQADQERHQQAGDSRRS